MNLDQIINIVVRTVTRRLVNKGINKGFDVAGRQMSRLGDKQERPPRGQAEAPPTKTDDA